MRSLDHRFSAIRARLDGALASTACLDTIAQRARELPDHWINQFGFECRLGDPDPALDFAVALMRREGVEALAALGSNHPGPEAEALRRLAEAWADPRSLLGAGVPVVWLEFDLAKSLGPTGVPSLFLGLGSRDTELETGLEGLLALRGAPLCPAVSASLSACFARLPPGTRVPFLGLLLSRPDAAIRVCVNRLPLDGVLPYLKALGWPGDSGRLRTLLDLALGPFDQVLLAFDLDAKGSLGERIGIECYAARTGWLSTRAFWSRTLDRLTDQGLCLPAKRDGVMAYGGFTRMDAAGAGLLPGRGPLLALMGTVNHLKLVLEPTGRVEAKAYLCVHDCAPAPPDEWGPEP
ncbi:hypothetical protein [Mesoterricola silvestris]|uniref:Uncharacterized protein n=1 Tax=Mesoterricola silvestris TaxID=2927979 RepID=A0AA48GHB9_9BACT|nr:hypothetical protein [Mesoterricola silvestris]BDU70959.1 hypothetical protein METEAL_01330 [Mesoterricola silvestris]